MRTNVPHNVLTLSEMTKRPNRITFEVIELGDMILTEDMIKKLRASSNMLVTPAAAITASPSFGFSALTKKL